VERSVEGHGQAVEWIFSHLDKHEIGAVGHRVVHGGERFRRPVRLTDAVIAEIEQLSDLAPLHNPPCLAAIRGAQAYLPTDIPMVAVFDTSFHATIPEMAFTYAIAHDLAARHGIRRYGFHGIAHQSLANGYAALTGRERSNTRLITLHLGNGCSATAILGGRSVDTSMGLTPLEGLVMGTRSGDLDPAIVAYLARRERVDAQTIEGWLNEKSGLLGVSGLSNDMRELFEAEAAGNPRAALAIELFCYRARKYIGAYLAVLGGADAVVFGGGIGEHSPIIRERICAGMEWCGLKLDRGRNRETVDLQIGQAARISPEETVLPAFVVAVDEETAIAEETVRCLNSSGES
jgi:acetate kinase